MTTTEVKKEKIVYIDKDKRETVEKCIEIDSPVLLIGETGLGKTTIIREIAKTKKKNLVRVSLNGSTSTEEILGKWLAKSGSTFWQDGVLVQAMKNGDWIVFDEINAALTEVLFILHSLLDDDRSITIVEKDNELLKPHKDFRFFATMNPSEEYSGTKEMNKALISRFTAVIYISVPSFETEVSILKDEGCDDTTATMLVKIAEQLRKKKEDEEIYYFCSTRDLLHAFHLQRAGIDIKNAIAYAIFGKMSRGEAVICKGVFDSTSVPGKTFAQVVAEIETFKKKAIESQQAMEKIATDMKTVNATRSMWETRATALNTENEMLRKKIATFEGSPTKTEDIKALLDKALKSLG